jgi:hypothetical protein
LISLKVFREFCIHVTSVVNPVGQVHTLVDLLAEVKVLKSLRHFNTWSESHLDAIAAEARRHPLDTPLERFLNQH